MVETVDPARPVTEAMEIRQTADRVCRVELVPIRKLRMGTTWFPIQE